MTCNEDTYSSGEPRRRSPPVRLPHVYSVSRLSRIERPQPIAMLRRNAKLFGRRRLFHSAARASTSSELPPSPRRNRAEESLKFLCRNGRLGEALVEMGLLGEQMGCRGYDLLLTESMNQKSLRGGQRVHAHTIKTRYSPSIYLANRIIIMYVRCGAPEDARKMLDGMAERTVVSWTAVMSGFSRGPLCGVAAELLVKMMREGIIPNEFTLATALAACGGEGTAAKGKQLHALALKQSLSPHVFVGSSLLDMYAKCGEIRRAQQVFSEMPHRDVVSCTAIISAYAQQGLDAKAILLFRQLLAEGMTPNCVTLAGVLAALAGLAAVDGGREVHCRAIKEALSPHPVMENSLIDMYAKSGSLLYARRVFDRMPQRTVSSWNTLLSGYGRHGLGEEALTLFESMIDDGVKPDGLTFMAVLTGCAHVGLVNEGLHLFRHVMRVHNCLPGMEHYGCIVDLLGRAGRLEAALEIVNGMPFDPKPAIWASLLGAAQAHGDVAVAELTAEMMMKADPLSSASYVSLANVYAGEGRWKDTFLLRKMMGKKMVIKKPGTSWNFTNLGKNFESNRRT